MIVLLVVFGVIFLAGGVIVGLYLRKRYLNKKIN
jgi:uncharacterized protein YneF (UPF0154 family)